MTFLDPIFNQEKDKLANDMRNNFLRTSDAPLLCDLDVVSNDGRHFKSSRTLLAARSNYFSSLLFSGDDDQKQSVIKVDLCSSSLIAILQFLISGSFDYNNSATMEAAKEIVKVRRDAKSINCDHMHHTCSRILQNILIHNNALAGYILDVSVNDPGDVRGFLFNSAIEVLCEDANTLDGDNKRNHMGCMSKKTLDVLLTTAYQRRKIGDSIVVTTGPNTNAMQKRIMFEKKWFEVVHYWFNTRNYFKPFDLIKPDSMFDITSKIDCKALPFNFLRDTVEPSGLVRSEELVRAYKYHAEINTTAHERMSSKLTQTVAAFGKERADMMNTHAQKMKRVQEFLRKYPSVYKFGQHLF